MPDSREKMQVQKTQCLIKTHLKFFKRIVDKATSHFVGAQKKISDTGGVSRERYFRMFRPLQPLLCWQHSR